MAKNKTTLPKQDDPRNSRWIKSLVYTEMEAKEFHALTDPTRISFALFGNYFTREQADEIIAAVNRRTFDPETGIKSSSPELVVFCIYRNNVPIPSCRDVHISSLDVSLQEYFNVDDDVLMISVYNHLGVLTDELRLEKTDRPGYKKLVRYERWKLEK